ncbi:hypothetical protein PTE30175_05413 [Pandoraea terrae]|uniref:Uncharacterized protein n=1 Tax=Pandoraea terrae TaxID=1537710 RepID=A0A5E4ZD49_9BURK|nr:hypothetical protein [Pandoraea terrae]VVE59311.1 hypothetical protein PTE30175_05413 [Pandoraea terrae]
MTQYSNPLSGPGLDVTVYASNTFPDGLKIDREDLSDDYPAASDVTKSGRITLHVKPSSKADRNLSILVDAYKRYAGRAHEFESIYVNARYPDGNLVAFYGCLIVGEPDDPKGINPSHPYSFHFERSFNAMAAAA